MDAFLFTVAMLCFVLVIKNWYLRLEKRSSEVQAEVARLKDEKLKYLVHLNHEIRNPMAAIVTGIELLHETNGSEHSNTKLASERIDYLVKSLGSTSAHVLSVLNDALELERIESGKDRMAASTFSVRMLMREMEEMQSIPAAALGSSIKVVLAEGLHDQWVGRESRIRQVLLNLTLNALKHANGGMVTLSVWEHDGSLNFSVADTGEGMSERALQHIYEPFSSSMGNDGAIGLGLAICKSIVENQLEGNISVTSVEGEGTTFSFSVPLVKASQVQGVAELIDERGSPRAATGRIDLKTLEGKSVLLVDDNEVNNAMVGMLLGHAGLVVEVARNSQEATGLIRDGKKFDFAVIDQNLGLLSELDGVSLTKSVLSTGVGDVVGLTGNVSTELEEDWLTAGAKKVLYKPVKGKELLSVLISCGAASFAAEPIGQQ
jgi:CheY-like chemotaxis protein